MIILGKLVIYILVLHEFIKYELVQMSSNCNTNVDYITL